MDTKALVKLLITVLLAAGGVAGAQYVQTDHVSFAEIVTAALGALVAGVQKSPILPKA